MTHRSISSSSLYGGCGCCGPSEERIFKSLLVHVILPGSELTELLRFCYTHNQGEDVDEDYFDTANVGIKVSTSVSDALAIFLAGGVEGHVGHALRSILAMTANTNGYGYESSGWLGCTLAQVSTGMHVSRAIACLVR